MSDTAHIDAAEAMYNALHVITDDPRISGWLVRHDPMALTQARNALAQYATESAAVMAEAVAFPMDNHCESDGANCLVHHGRIVPGWFPEVCDLSPDYVDA